MGTNVKKLFSGVVAGGGLLALLTIATSGVFKIAAFAREAFIASHFGLSSFTDAYFAFQQFPLIVMTFMFGAFSLAFTPAYANEKRANGSVTWLGALLVWGTVTGLALTLLTALFAPLLLPAFTGAPSPHSAATLVALGATFAPIIWLGIWAGITIADGRNLQAMFVAGLPYLLMTLLLLALYWTGTLDDLSLPLSFLAGFGVVGAYALYSIMARDLTGLSGLNLLATWKSPSFRKFLTNLSASSLENVGFSANQLLLIFFIAKGGIGAVSANACAMRVGMLGLSLLGQPLSQLVQAKLCAAQEHDQLAVFKRWMWAVAGAVLALAAVLFFGREPIVSLIYLRGKFSAIELRQVLRIMPAWIGYFVVSSLNAIVARYLFGKGNGGIYVRRQLWAYTLANATRAFFGTRLDLNMVVWCSVVAEGAALLMNLRTCFRTTLVSPLQPQMVGAQEI